MTPGDNPAARVFALRIILAKAFSLFGEGLARLFSRHSPFEGLTVNACADARLSHSDLKQMSTELHVKVVVIEKILCYARYCRPQGIGHREQEDPGDRGLALFVDPIHESLHAALVFREKKMQDEQYPR